MQPYAERFGEACSIDQKFIMNFGEEVIRGHPAFVLSRIVQVWGACERYSSGSDYNFYLQSSTAAINTNV